ncbi:hypothetical protein L3V23_06150 [Vibrio sp. A1-b2]|uniref:hypothetical protein n=1 Tax=Vibrio sp. A1-b2 TaxID=2912248 RepID=UPI001F2F3C34|nr:hypothetical protein [Vibrio sp. A1-b2]MCF7361655.1 hypothetical protein [Vibrio sp. A1-b2]
MYTCRYLVLLFLSVYFSFSSSVSASQETSTLAEKIYVKNDRLFFRGEITHDSINYAFSEIEKYKGNIRYMTVKSQGGDIIPAMQLGRWIYDHDIALTVDQCFSSCANYFFTAAASVHINKGAVVGWHGGALQKNFKPDADADSYDWKHWHTITTLERNFFEHIGVNEDITIYGQLNDFALMKAEPSCIEADKKGHLDGWTFSIEDLKHFGVNHVSSDNKVPSTDYPNGWTAVCIIPVS